MYLSFLRICKRNSSGGEQRKKKELLCLEGDVRIIKKRIRRTIITLITIKSNNSKQTD